MSSRNPGRYRKEGREAFIPHANPLDFNPYRNSIGSLGMKHDEWNDGWRQAEKAYVPPPDPEAWVDPDILRELLREGAKMIQFREGDLDDWPRRVEELIGLNHE